MYKVVIIDDNKLTADSLAKLALWREYGCTVERVCYDSLAGKEAIMMIRPEIIISDIQLPGLNGLDIIDMVKPELPWTKVIFISAFDQFKYAQRALRLGAHDYLLKPFSQSAFSQSVKSAVEQLQKARRELEDAPPAQEAAEESDLPEKKLAKPIFNYIMQRIDQHITAEEVAAAFFMSTSRLDRFLKAHYGKGFRELRIELRMSMAKSLLVDVRYNVEDVGTKIGYKSYISFYRAFTREYGVSPTEYREQAQPKA